MLEEMVIIEMIKEGLDPKNKNDIEIFWEKRLS